MKIVPVVQVTSLLPSKTASESEHVTSTTVPGLTGNCVVVFIVLVHPAFSPVQSGAVGMIVCSLLPVKCKQLVNKVFFDAFIIDMPLHIR